MASGSGVEAASFSPSSPESAVATSYPRRSRKRRVTARSFALSSIRTIRWRCSMVRLRADYAGTWPTQRCTLRSTMKLIVGLGNPGREYERTRHNIGWWVLDAFAKKFRIEIVRHEKNALTGEGRVAGGSV